MHVLKVTTLNKKPLVEQTNKQIGSLRFVNSKSERANLRVLFRGICLSEVKKQQKTYQRFFSFNAISESSLTTRILIF